MQHHFVGDIGDVTKIRFAALVDRRTAGVSATSDAEVVLVPASGCHRVSHRRMEAHVPESAGPVPKLRLKAL